MHLPTPEVGGYFAQLIGLQEPGKSLRRHASQPAAEGTDMSAKRVLLLGESWVSAATHYKGFDQFSSVTFHTGADDFVAALKGEPFEVTWLVAHQAVTGLPF